MNKKEKKAKEIISTIMYRILAVGIVALVILSYKSVISGVGFLVIFSILFMGAYLLEQWEDGSGKGEVIITTSDTPARDENNETTEFIRPIGTIRTPWNGEKSFMDYYGHEYHELGGTYYDENGNFVPDCLKDYYGLPNFDDDDE